MRQLLERTQEIVADKVRMYPGRALAICGLSTIAHKYRDAYNAPGLPSPLNVLVPNPLDILNHIGNMAFSAPIGIAAGVAVASWHLERHPDATADSGKNRAKIAALAVTALANALAELRWGQKIIHLPNVPDFLDFADGVGAGVVASTIACDPRPTQMQPPEV